MDNPDKRPEEDDPQDALQQFLEGLLGSGAAEEAARAMRASGFDLSALPGFGSPQAMAQAMNQMRFLMGASSDPVNWRMVSDLSRQHAYQSGDPRLSSAQEQAVRQALSVADLWLDPVTLFALKNAEREAWTRVDWIDQTLPAWKEISNPVALNASRAMVEAMDDEMGSTSLGLPEELAGLAGSLSTMLPKMAAMAFGAQVGQALAAMSKESLGSSDTGLPLAADQVTALVPTNIDAFGEGLDIPHDEVVQFIATRECAHARLFTSVPWLRHDLQLAILRYAEEITLDPDAIADAARSIDPTDPDSLNQAMAQGVFAAEPTESQSRALERLETLLALIEGWIEVVTSAAVQPYLPHASQLREMVRRRRITGSSAELLLSRLVGLELRPREARGAAKLFQMVQDQQGQAARDELWSHPDRIPTAQDLANPEGFFERIDSEVDALSEFDEELSKLLDGTLGWDEGVPEDRRGEAGGGSNAESNPADPDAT